MKRITAILLTLLLPFAVEINALAIGWEDYGGYSTNNTVQFMIDASETVMVYNKDFYDWVDYDEVLTGGSLYVPLYSLDYDNGNEGRATAKQVKELDVKVSYKALSGAQYIKDVSIVDGKKEKIKQLQAGAYIKIEIDSVYTGTRYGYVNLKMNLSVNKVGYQQTQAQLICNVRNYLQNINGNAAYSAQVPTRFEVVGSYSGEVTFDMGGKIRYTTKVAKGGKYVINFDRTPDYDVDLMYPDAYLEFYSFLGENDAFASVGTLEIPINKASFKGKDGQSRVFAYEIVEGGQLKAIDSRSATYNARTQKLTIKTQTLGNYVLSNQKLFQTVENDNDMTFQSGYATPGAATAAA